MTEQRLVLCYDKVNGVPVNGVLYNMLLLPGFNGMYMQNSLLKKVNPSKTHIRFTP